MCHGNTFFVTFLYRHSSNVHQSLFGRIVCFYSVFTTMYIKMKKMEKTMFVQGGGIVMKPVYFVKSN